MSIVMYLLLSTFGLSDPRGRLSASHLHPKSNKCAPACRVEGACDGQPE